MTSVVRSTAAAAMVLMLLAGSAAVAYAAWMRPAADGDAALADGRYEQALASYAAAETRFDRIAAAKELFADDYGHVMANRLWILHRLERAPESAAPHFWSGCAFFEKARAEEKPDMRLGWLTRAEEELRRAVEAAPDDWDTKYDFELVTKLAAELRKQPKTPPNQLMQLLRPQPKPGAKPVKRVG